MIPVASNHTGLDSSLKNHFWPAAAFAVTGPDGANVTGLIGVFGNTTVPSEKGWFRLPSRHPKPDGYVRVTEETRPVGPKVGAVALKAIRWSVLDPVVPPVTGIVESRSAEPSTRSRTLAGVALPKRSEEFTNPPPPVPKATLVLMPGLFAPWFDGVLTMLVNTPTIEPALSSPLKCRRPRVVLSARLPTTTSGPPVIALLWATVTRY